MQWNCSWLYLTASISFKWDDMDVSRNRHTETILRMMILTGFPSKKPSSVNTLEVSQGDSRWSVFHSKIRQQNTVDWLFLVRLCRRIQAWTRNNGYRSYRRWQPWMYDFGLCTDTWQRNVGKLREESCRLVQFLPYQHTRASETDFQQGGMWRFLFKGNFYQAVVRKWFPCNKPFQEYDAVLFYPTLEKRTGKRGRPKLHDGKIDFENLDTTRCTEYKVDNGRLYGLKAYSKALRRFVILAVWYPMDGRTDKWQLYFSTDEMQDAKEVLDFYRTRFKLEFCFRDAKQHAGMMNCQATDFRKLAFHFNASLAAINLAKAACKKMGIKYSISSCKSVIHNAYMLERFICVSGIEPNTQLIDKLFKELILFTARAA